MKTLLAKKPLKVGRVMKEETLYGHTMAVVKSAATILRLLEYQTREVLGLNTYNWKIVKQAVLRAALLHDLGKANHQFQAMLRVSNKRQALRHEWISAWLPLHHTKFADWLFAGDGVIRDITLSAVLGHHLKTSCGDVVRPRSACGDKQIQCFWQHDDFQKCLVEAAPLVGLSSHPPILPSQTIDLLTSSPLAELLHWIIDNDILNGQELIPIVKAFLMAADLAGSAIPFKTEMPISSWIEQTLGHLCTREALVEIVRNRLGSQKPRVFQKKAAQGNGRVTLIRAGCGSGKTVAAYLWAVEKAAGRKLFMCYPTMGTATEGFRDYLFPLGESCQGALLHSRSKLDIAELLQDGEEGAEQSWQHAFGIKALTAWDVRVTVCTADTVLGIIQNARQVLYSFPALLCGAFVFDEIHQYDQRLFLALLRFLKVFQGSPVLLMTASLPEARRKALQQILPQEMMIVDGPADLEQLPRYQLVKVDPSTRPWEEIRRILEDGQKVLWVSNTVARCVAVGREAVRRLGNIRVIPYHSRYRYCDRLKRHQAIIQAFRSDEPVLAVTTQVCEVSLDISADLLVSDLAPIPALIQRLGRLNRRITPQNSGTLGRAIFVRPENALPYKKQELDQAAEWLEHFGNQPVSQADLKQAFEQIVAREGELGPPLESAWLDSGKFSKQAPLREASYTFPVLRAEDAHKIRNKQRAISLAVLCHEIPMPLSEVDQEMREWLRLRHAWVAPPGRMDYNPRWGGKWLKKARKAGLMPEC